jgi:hypothetical protein
MTIKVTDYLKVLYESLPKEDYRGPLYDKAVSYTLDLLAQNGYNLNAVNTVDDLMLVMLDYSLNNHAGQHISLFGTNSDYVNRALFWPICDAYKQNGIDLTERGSWGGFSSEAYAIRDLCDYPQTHLRRAMERVKPVKDILRKGSEETGFDLGNI